MQAGLARITVRGPAEHAVLELAGELDFSSVDALHEIVSRLPHRIVAIDLSGLEFVDGAGARVIEQIRAERLARHGERPRLAAPSGAVGRTLQLVKARQRSLLAR